MKYIDTLLMWIMFLATWVIYTVLAVGVVIALRAVIPLHLASLFDVSQTWIGWIVLVLVAVLVAFFCFCQVWVFQFVTFLNRYYTNDGGAFNTDPGPRQPNNFVPLPAVELPSFRPTPVQEEHVGEGLPPATDRVAAQQQAAQYAQTPKPQPQQDAAEITGMNLLGAATKPAAQPAAQPSGAADDLHNLQISQSSINTAEEDANEITQHLHQVYTPSQDNIIQYGDEDRMPTILFDDEMAKQLEETAQKFAAKKNKPEGPQEPDSIKISE